MKVCDYIARSLHKRDVKVVFGLIGGMIAFLVESLSKHQKIAFITFHHEQSAAFAADAYGRMTGKPTVVMATSGPGATNLITGIGSCYFDSSPAVFITGQVSRKELMSKRPVRQLGFQETDIVTVVRSLTKSAKSINDPNGCAGALDNAFDIATSGRPGPVLLDIPIDVQKEEITGKMAGTSLDLLHTKDDIPKFADRFIKALSKAKRPLILAGGGVRASGSREMFLKFLKNSRIPVVHSLLGVDALDSLHPQRVGMIGSYGNRYANIAIKEADLLLVLGSRLDIRQTGTEVDSFREGKKIFHVDVERAELNNRIKSCDICYCDLKFFFRHMINGSVLLPTIDIQGWQERLSSLMSMYPDADEQPPLKSGINPNSFITALSKASPEACGYAVDVGQHQMWAAQSIWLHKEQRFITSGGMGAMGFALPAAIGMAYACVRKPVVVIAGDGAFQVNIQELETIKRHNLPLKIVVMNNHSLGMVRQFQDEVSQMSHQGTVDGYSVPDFVRISKAYGIPAKTIARQSQIPSAMKWLWKETLTPALLQVDIDIRLNANPKIQFRRSIHQMEPKAPLGWQGKANNFMLTRAEEFSAFENQKDLLIRFQNKRIFLSGGTGFLGKWLLESFLYFNKAFALNATMTVLSRNPQAFLIDRPELKDVPALTFIQGDIRNFMFPDGPHDFMIHAAGEVNSIETHSIIVEGTRRVLNFAAKTGASRLMIMSSGAVYGPQPDGMNHLPETYDGLPSTAYGRAKLLAEQECVEAGYRHGFDVLLPRCFSFVGPYLNLDIHYAIGNFIRDCLESRPIIIKGDGTTTRSYLYAADLAQWLWTILLCGAHARPYNVGSAEGITIQDLAYRVRDCAGVSNPVEILGTTIPGTRTDRYVPSIDRASSELNLKPLYSLNEAINRTLAWYR